MVTATTLLPPSMIHGPATAVAGKKDRTEVKAEIIAKPVEQKMTTDKSSQQGQQISGSEQHRSTRPDGSEVLITLQEGGAVTKNPIPPGHSTKLKLAMASATTPPTPQPTLMDKIA